MSGSPKYSQAELDRRRRQQLEEERRRKAEEEARRRREAAERERKQRLEELRRKLLAEAEKIVVEANQSHARIYDDDASRISKMCKQVISAIKSAQTESKLRNAYSTVSQISADTKKAVARKRRDDEEKKRVEELDRQKFVLSELNRLLNDMSKDDAKKFDSQGRVSVERLLSSVASLISKGNPQSVRVPLSEAERSVQKHIDLVSQARADWLNRKGEAEAVIGELRSLIEGLKADDVVMRWYAAAVQVMANMLTEAEQAVASEDFEKPSAIFKQAIADADKTIAEANQAQLKADERDYIVGSISNALADLGFYVDKPQAEHPDSAATAMVFRAINEKSEGVAVSVPFEGEVYYDVGGYALGTDQKVDGSGRAKTCDKAQAMLEEIHEALAQRYGINMSELMWEDKDPNRNIRAADQLPVDGSNATRGYTR